MNKIKRSGKLLQAAFAVLFREKKLLLFPLIATVLAGVVALFFVAPIAFYPTGHSYFSADHWNAISDKITHGVQWLHLQSNKPAKAGPLEITGTGTLPIFTAKPWVAAIFAAAYFASMFLATFSNVAFYHEIMQALNGNAVSIRRGFRFAATRWKAVLLWSLFAGLVGYLIQALQERLGMIGRLVTGLMGFVWSVACIFIIPTLVRDTETSNPFTHLRHSVGTLKRTWGELIIGFAGLELAFSAVFMTGLLLLILVVGAVGFGLGFQWHLHYMMIFLMGFGAMMLIILPLSWISSVVNPVYR